MKTTTRKKTRKMMKITRMTKRKMTMIYRRKRRRTMTISCRRRKRMTMTISKLIWAARSGLVTDQQIEHELAYPPIPTLTAIAFSPALYSPRLILTSMTVSRAFFKPFFFCHFLFFYSFHGLLTLLMSKESMEP